MKIVGLVAVSLVSSRPVSPVEFHRGIIEAFMEGRVYRLLF